MRFMSPTFRTESHAKRKVLVFMHEDKDSSDKEISFIFLPPRKLFCLQMNLYVVWFARTRGK